MAQAAALALDLGHPLKDCVYLAMAMELGCDLVTCDARFAEKACEAWAGVRLLGA
jgi:predicted nucleic acid-binding protein